MPGTHDKCRSCQRPVLFIPSATSDKAMILDERPEKRVIIVPAPLRELEDGTPDLSGPRWVAEVVDTYTPHHATCPKAAEWKGRSRANPPD